jgi:uncharacterized protein (TIGR02996 family)
VTDDRKALWRAIALNPGEDTPKLQLADWYAEHGDEATSYALRWCVSRGVWPVEGLRRSIWCRQVTRPGRNHLPATVFDLIPNGRDGIPTPLLMYQSWCSTESAVRALSRALAKLRAACEIPA